MRVGVIGDVHANGGFLHTAYAMLVNKGCEEIWQVGDFGYWPRSEFGQHFLKFATHMVKREKVPIYFADGNHEDHEMLQQGGVAPYLVAPGIYHVPRGVTIEREGNKIMFVGGAVSVDRKWRKLGVSWFANEFISESEAEHIKALGPVDIVVAHDVPHGVPLTLSNGWPVTDVAEANEHRRTILEIAKALTPSLWLAGHYHQRVTFVMDPGIQVEALDCDINPRFNQSYMWIDI